MISKVLLLENYSGVQKIIKIKEKLPISNDTTLITILLLQALSYMGQWHAINDVRSVTAENNLSVTFNVVVLGIVVSVHATRQKVHGFKPSQQ
jgi:hypothetical protein